MNTKTLRDTAKWIWTTAVLVFVIIYSITKKDIISDTLSLLPLASLLGATALVVAAKLCLVANMQTAARQFKIFLRWKDCYCIYNLTQLAKYIPGYIWHFVGRITTLHERGIAAQAIRDSLFAEHFWIVASAFILASLLVFTNIHDFFEAQFANINSGLLPTWILVALVLFAAVTALILLGYKRLFHWLLRLLPPLGAIPILLLIWIFLGASLWVTLTPFVLSMPSILYIIGVYCFAYASGFLVPFAPAGLGIREAILTFSLTPFMAADVAILLAAVNRIIYFAVEILLVIFCLGKNK